MAYSLLFAKSDTVSNFNGITTGTGAITLASGNFSVSGTQLFVLDYDNVNAEVVSATVSGTTMTLVARGLDGTSAVTHTAPNCAVGMMIVPSHYGNGLGALAAADAFTAATTGATNFASTTSDVLRWFQIGKLVFVNLALSGTASNTTHAITLPVAAKSSVDLAGFRSINDTTSGTGRITLTASSATASIFKDTAANAWTNSVVNAIYGTFFYEAL